MTALISKQRYNWMGYHGTESQDVDNGLLRLDPSSKGSNFDYDHRQEVIADIKERLYLIKRDLDLIPEEELRAEEEERQRRREERKRREEEEAIRREEEERQRAEAAERRAREDAEREEQERIRRAEQEERDRKQAQIDEINARRWRALRDSDEDSDDEEERNALLQNKPRSQAEINKAVAGFSAGTRALLISRDQGYVSYLDGSNHTSLSGLEKHNSSRAAAVAKSVHGTKASVPDAAAFSTEELRATLAARDAARKKLDARRVQADSKYLARIRKSERSSLPALTEADGDENALLVKLDDAKEEHDRCRIDYNARAAAAAKTLNIAAASRVPAGGLPYEEEEEAAPAPAPAPPVEEPKPEEGEYPVEEPAAEEGEYPVEEPAVEASAPAEEESPKEM